MKGKDATIQFNQKILQPQKAELQNLLFAKCASSYLSGLKRLEGHYITGKNK